MTKTEKILILLAAAFFTAGIFFLPSAETARQVEPAFLQPGPTARAGSGAVMITLVTEFDLNTADADTLTALPGVGPTLAEAIIAYREEHGPFSHVDELLNVRGYGEGNLAALYAAMGRERP